MPSMILALTLCSTALALASAIADQAMAAPVTSFDTFVAQYERRYNNADEARRRRAIFEANVLEIARLNARSARGAVFAVNGFADLSPEEFRASYTLGANANLRPLNASYAPAAVAGGDAVPSAKNWYLTATTPVRNQGQCGSCWAFSVVEQVESDWFLAGKGGAKPQALSVQEVVDCDSNEAFGCSGTYAGGDTGFKYVINNGGLASESDYPYTSGTTKESGKCKSKSVKNAGGAITGFANPIKTCDLPWDDCNNQDEDALAAFVGTKGPLAICINARGWQFYKSGVATAAMCGGHDHGSLDHCVQLVGYSGYDAGKGAKGSGAAGGYWIVRNSWMFGPDKPWGEDGLIYLALGNNTCGVADTPTYTVV